MVSLHHVPELFNCMALDPWRLWAFELWQIQMNICRDEAGQPPFYCAIFGTWPDVALLLCSLVQLGWHCLIPIVHHCAIVSIWHQAFTYR